MFYEILKFLGKSINVRDVIHTKRINASSALVNNQPPTHKCVGGAERVNPKISSLQTHKEIINRNILYLIKDNSLTDQQQLINNKKSMDIQLYSKYSLS